jgi:hypothetical protein
MDRREAGKERSKRQSGDDAAAKADGARRWDMLHARAMINR